jgi:precorrin-8X/cobalt-precorrin-8 methylmutase
MTTAMARIITTITITARRSSIMSAPRPLFDTYLMVDWSAANTPKRGRDSIWFHQLERTAPGMRIAAHENPPTRAEAYRRLHAILAAGLARNASILAGFDFPFAYAGGLARRLGLAPPAWRSIWDVIATLVTDDERNCSNRFAVAAELNRRISGGAFPFWGCPLSQVGPCLAMTHHRRHDAEDLAERRRSDRMPGIQPGWKLFGNGSAGSQALTGIPIVRRLRDDPALAASALVWPFETGLRAPAPIGDVGRIILAEIYPSLRPVVPTPGEVKDSTQVRTLAQYFAELDTRGELAAVFAGDSRLSADERIVVEQEEGWVLGIVGDAATAVLKDAPPHDGLKDTLPHIRHPGESRGPSLHRRVIGGMDSDFRRNDDHGGEGVTSFDYLRDPAAIYDRSFVLIRAETDLSTIPRDVRPLALRLVHAVADPTILRDLRWSPGVVAAGRAALAAGAPILVDAAMVAHGVTRRRLPAENKVICTLDDPAVPGIATTLATTRSAAAVELWRPHLDGAVVAIGNAPTALFRLLELLDGGAPRPAAVIGIPVGFIGAAESKRALAESGLEHLVVHGRRGGSAMTVAAVNAIASAAE